MAPQTPLDFFRFTDREPRTEKSKALRFSHMPIRFQFSD